MAAQPNVDKLVRQTFQYEFSDGLRDLQLAVLLGIGGVTVWLALDPLWITFIATLMQVLGRWAAWLSMLLVLVAPLAALGSLGLMNILRRRWLWRESGMIKSRWSVSRRVSVLSALIFVGGVALAFYARSLGWADDLFVLRMLWAATGWSFGYTLIGVGHDIGLSRYIWLGCVGGLISTALLFLPLAFGQTALALGLGWGLLLAASGLITLRRVILSVRPSR